MIKAIGKFLKLGNLSMATRFAQIVLWFAGLQLLGFGLYASYDPVGLLSPLGFAFAKAEAIVEARAFYGGAELGLGVALCWAALRERWLEFALVIAACLFLGIAAVRGFGMWQSGAQSNFLWFALVIEILTGLGAVVAYRAKLAR
jgi:hypothetical protein